MNTNFTLLQHEEAQQCSFASFFLLKGINREATKEAAARRRMFISKASFLHEAIHNASQRQGNKLEIKIETI